MKLQDKFKVGELAVVEAVNPSTDKPVYEMVRIIRFGLTQVVLDVVYSDFRGLPRNLHVNYNSYVLKNMRKPNSLELLLYT